MKIKNSINSLWEGMDSTLNFDYPPQRPLQEAAISEEGSRAVLIEEIALNWISCGYSGAGYLS
jgi:hypothetical protein